MFESTENKINLILNENRTINEMLSIYLKIIKKPDLVEQKYNPRFIFSGKDLTFEDKTLMSQFFNIYSHPKITVVWPNELTGGP